MRNINTEYNSRNSSRRDSSFQDDLYREPGQFNRNLQPGQFDRNRESYHKGIDSVIRPFVWSLGAAQELVFPRRCPVCDRPVRPAGALICSDCEEILQKVEGPVCRRCGKPIRSGTPHLCGDCRSIQHIYERGCAVFTYHSTAGGLFRFKYGGRQEYGAFFGRCMAEKLAEFAAEPAGAQYSGQVFSKELAQGSAEALVRKSGKGSGKRISKGGLFAVPEIIVRGPSRPDYLIPVPVSEHRLEKRGYNQALILAREISRLTGIPIREDILGRISDTRPMKNMAPAERQNNLKKAFQVFGNDVELNSIMLIDDIYTTGATVDACAHALYAHGARRVFFMTLAIGEDSRF